MERVEPLQHLTYGLKKKEQKVKSLKRPLQGQQENLDTKMEALGF